jgi:hypothetical protein
MDEATYTITQRRFLHGSQQFTIDGNTLRIEHRRGLSLEQQCLDLGGFQPAPLRIKRVPLGKMLALLISVALAITLLTWALRTSNDSASATAMTFGLLSAFVALIIAIQTCFGFANVVVFQGKFRQIRLWHDLPDKSTFDAFVEALSAQIRRTRDYEHTLLRQLRTANIINDQQYNQGAELLRRHADRPDEWYV